jgi:hypothetical protein
MSHSTDYLRWLSGLETDNAPKEETRGPGQVRGALYTQTHYQGSRSQHSCAARAAENLARLCLAPLTPQEVQPPSTRSTDTIGQES